MKKRELLQLLFVEPIKKSETYVKASILKYLQEIELKIKRR
jgi:hypothetical protein